MNPTFADRYRATVGMLSWMLMRASGVILTIYMLVYLFYLRSAQRGAAAFDQVVARFQSPFWIVMNIILLGIVTFHFFNGIRHLVLEAGYGARIQRTLFWVALALAIGVTGLYGVLAFTYLPATVVR